MAVEMTFTIPPAAVPPGTLPCEWTGIAVAGMRNQIPSHLTVSDYTQNDEDGTIVVTIDYATLPGGFQVSGGDIKALLDGQWPVVRATILQGGPLSHVTYASAEV
jgi:hypothetical protein